MSLIVKSHHHETQGDVVKAAKGNNGLDSTTTIATQPPVSSLESDQPLTPEDVGDPEDAAFFNSFLEKRVSNGVGR